VDDTTGVVTCVLWLNQFSQQRQNQGHAQLRTWILKQNIDIGDTISVLAQLEEFRDKVQLTVHKMRIIKDSGEEMLQYQ
jgi:hypothetical protein